MNRDLLKEVLKDERLFGLFLHHHPVAAFRDDLTAAGYTTAEGLRQRKDGDWVKVAGRVIIVHTPPTKSGVRVMFVTLEDETGLIDLAVFPKAQERCARTILSKVIVLAEGQASRQGARDVSVVAQRVLTLKEFYGELRRKAG
jgi:error-prone DNA polymerase